MLEATLGDYKFRVNPTSMSWEYSINSRVTDTKGGRVVQILSCSIGDIKVEGTFGSGGAGAMQEFERAFIAMANAQNQYGRSFTFSFPYNGMKPMQVYVKDFPSVRYNNTQHAPEFTVTLVPDDDAPAELVTTSKSVEIDKIMNGVGWTKSKFNNYEMDEAGAEAQEAALTEEFNPEQWSTALSMSSMPSVESDSTPTASVSTSSATGTSTEPTFDFSQKSGIIYRGVRQ